MLYKLHLFRFAVKYHFYACSPSLVSSANPLSQQVTHKKNVDWLLLKY